MHVCDRHSCQSSSGAQCSRASPVSVLLRPSASTVGPSYAPVALRYWARLSSWPARRSLGRQEEVGEEREKYGGRREKRQDQLFAVVRGCAHAGCCGFVDVRRAVQRCSRQHHKTLEARPTSICYYEASVISESEHTLASFLSGSCTPRTNTITSRESVVDNSELNFKFKAQKMLRAVTHWQSHCDKLNEMCGRINSVFNLSYYLHVLRLQWPPAEAKLSDKMHSPKNAQRHAKSSSGKRRSSSARPRRRAPPPRGSSGRMTPWRTF